MRVYRREPPCILAPDIVHGRVIQCGTLGCAHVFLFAVEFFHEPSVLLEITKMYFSFLPDFAHIRAYDLVLVLTRCYSRSDNRNQSSSRELVKQCALSAFSNNMSNIVRHLLCSTKGI